MIRPFLACSLGLLTACSVASPPAAPIPLTTPQCASGQTLESNGTTWECLDVNTAGIDRVSRAKSADHADTAGFVQTAGDAGTADFVLQASYPSVGDALLPDGGAVALSPPDGTTIVHDGNPVPSLMLMSVSPGHEDGGVDQLIATLALADTQDPHVQLTTFGSLTGHLAGTDPTHLANCKLLIIETASDTTVFATTVHPGQTDAGVDLPAMWSGMAEYTAPTLPTTFELHLTYDIPSECSVTQPTAVFSEEAL